MTSKVKENSYITIQGFMVTELGLKGNELFDLRNYLWL